MLPEHALPTVRTTMFSVVMAVAPTLLSLATPSLEVVRRAAATTPAPPALSYALVSFGLNVHF